MIRLSDVRYALRLWRRHPAMVVVAGLSLGLGVGATTTMYSVVNRVANYELGFAEADRLAVLWSTNPEQGIREQPPNWEIVRAILEHGQSFESFGFFQGNGAPVTLTGTTETSRVSQMPVDVNALSVVGVKPAARAHLPSRRLRRRGQAEGSAGDRRSATTRGSGGSAARRTSIGTSIHVDGEPRTIIGVMPKGFALVPWEDDIAFWAANDLRKIPEARWMIAVGRLKPGVSLGVGAGRGDRHHPPGARSARREAGRHAARRSCRCTTRSSATRTNGPHVPARRGQLRAADRVRQRGEPAARRRHGAAEGAGACAPPPGPAAGASCSSSSPRTCCSSLVGCGFGLALAFWGTRLFALIVPDRLSRAAAPHLRRRPRARVRARDLGRVEPRLRTGAGAARIARRSERRAQGRRARIERRARRRTKRAARRRGRAVDGAAGRAPGS